LAAITVGDLPEETHRGLKVRATQRGRSTEAEMREIIEQAVRPTGRIQLGAELEALGKRFGGVDLDIPARDKEPIEPASFE
jgi:plasmid stability protein